MCFVGCSYYLPEFTGFLGVHCRRSEKKMYLTLKMTHPQGSWLTFWEWNLEPKYLPEVIIPPQSPSEKVIGSLGHILKLVWMETTWNYYWESVMWMLWSELQMTHSFWQFPCGPRSSMSCDMVAEQKIYGSGVNPKNPVAAKRWFQVDEISFNSSREGGEIHFWVRGYSTS